MSQTSKHLTVMLAVFLFSVPAVSFAQSAREKREALRAAKEA
jgi:hypothetical protein